MSGKDDDTRRSNVCEATDVVWSVWPKKEHRLSCQHWTEDKWDRRAEVTTAQTGDITELMAQNVASQKKTWKIEKGWKLSAKKPQGKLRTMMLIIEQLQSR